MIDMLALTLLADAPASGDYFSPIKILVMVVLLLPWLYASTWVNKDAVHIHGNQMLWSCLVLGLGAAGAALWLLLPWYFLGLGLFVVAFATVFGIYVAYRNTHVLPEARVLTVEHIKAALAKKTEHKIDLVQRVKLYNVLTRPVFAPDESDRAGRLAYNLTQNLLFNVITMRASDVDIVPNAEQANVKFVIDGVAQAQSPAAKEESEAVIDYLKSIAGLNVDEKRKPQSAKILMEAGAISLDMYITTAGTTHGQRMQIRMTQEAAKTNLDELGLSDDVKARMEKINASAHGVILVSSTKRNGLTSMLYSLLRKHDPFTKQLATLETAKTIDLENVTQTPYKDQAALLDAFVRLLRRDPDILAVDRCENPAVVQEAITAAERKLIYLGLPAESTLAALAKWVALCGDEKADGMGVLLGITCQVLVRKLCPNCREAYPPVREVMAKLNIPADKVENFYRPPTKPLTDEKGNPIICPTCRGTGYFGRTGVYELMAITDEIRQLVEENASPSQIKAACRKHKMLFLQEQALRKVVEGVTSVEEVIRVTRAAKGQEA